MLTKSQFMNYVKCPVYFWLAKHRPDLIPEDTAATQRLFAMGKEVDLLSRQLFSGGVETAGFNQEGWENTQALLAGSAKVIFQPTAVAEPLTCRADILTRNGAKWDLHEVKQSNSVQPKHIFDVGFQRICFESAGVKIGRSYLVHLNREYVRQGAIEPEKLFISEDITDEVLEKMDEIKEEIAKALEILKWTKEPDKRLIKLCSTPKNCEYLKYYCEGVAGVPEIAAEIGSKHLLALIKRGIIAPEKLSAEILTKVGYEPEEPFTKIDAPSIRRELKKLEYPLYFFDYETYGEAIPPFDGTRPHQQIPFQYSLHIKDSPDAEIRHLEFLATKFENPVSELLAQLKRDIEPKGSVIVWFESFEKSRNEEMAKMMPEYADLLDDLNERIFDLYLIFKIKSEMYSDSEFQGSASLKAVLPVLCPELSYESLEIQEGGTASSSWPILTSDKTPVAEKEKLKNNMLEYCQRDTEAMVGILNKVCEDIDCKIQ
nr:DUF2779 domain-containing protein [Candidatus Magasanikbacteria bacterium]